MEFTDLQINADYRQIGGSARAKYDKNAGNIANADSKFAIDNYFDYYKTVNIIENNMFTST